MINNGLKVSEGLSTKARVKHLADRLVVRDLLTYLWTLDEYEYQHPRMRVQVGFSLLMMHYMGLRPGEFTESTAHVGSNEGLLWKDLEIRIIPDANGMPLFTAQVSIRNRKGARDREDKT